MSLPEFVSPVVFSVAAFHLCMYCCELIQDILGICYPTLFFLSIQPLLQFTHITLYYINFGLLTNTFLIISKYCVSAIFPMSFVVYGI